MSKIRKTCTAEYTCNKCGKTETITYKGLEGFKKEQFHYVFLDRPGYGSIFDGLDIEFDLCDDCLKALLDSFVIPISGGREEDIAIH